MNEITQLTGEQLASQIEEAIRTDSLGGDTIQISLWFGGVADRGEYAGQAVGVTSASVAMSRFPGMVATESNLTEFDPYCCVVADDPNHIEFGINVYCWNGLSNTGKIKASLAFIDFALKFSPTIFGGKLGAM